MILIGTKHDLKEAYDNNESNIKMGKRSVSLQEGKSLARKIGALGYFETSAKTGKGIKEAINVILISAIESRRDRNLSLVENNTCCAFKCYLSSCLFSCLNRDSQ